MSIFTTLHASHQAGQTFAESLLVVLASWPNFQASLLAMAYYIAVYASVYVFNDALRRLVAYFVALKTQFFSAFKWIMCVFSTQNAIHLFTLVRTIFCEMTVLLAIMTLDCWVVVRIVPCYLFLQFLVIIVWINFIFRVIWLLFFFLICIWLISHFEVHVTLQRTSWYQ